MYLERRKYFAKLSPRKVIRELHEQPLGPFDGRKKGIRQVDLLLRRPRCARHGCDETHRGILHGKLNCRSSHLSGSAAPAEIIPLEARHWTHVARRTLLAQRVLSDELVIECGEPVQNEEADERRCNSVSFSV